MNIPCVLLLFFARILIVSPTNICTTSVDDEAQGIRAHIHESSDQYTHIGSTVRYHCSVQRSDSNNIRIEWSKENSRLPHNRSQVDAHGVLVIRDVKDSDCGVYVCRISDAVKITTQKLTLHVDVTASSPPPPLTPTIIPMDWVGESNDTVILVCVAPVFGKPINWTRAGDAELPSSAIVENGILTIPNAEPSHSGFYNCIVMIDQKLQTATASVTIRQSTRPVDVNVGLDKQISIEPPILLEESGQTIELKCNAPDGTNITWTRFGNTSLPLSAIQQGRVLTIYNSTYSDSGTYVCTTITSENVSISTAEVKVTIHGLEPSIKVQVMPNEQNVREGSVVRVECIAEGSPTPTVAWTKSGEKLGAHVQITGGNLTISKPQVSDSGTYTCHANNSDGSASGSAKIQVKPAPSPPIIEPNNWIGGPNDTIRLKCNAEVDAKITWSRADDASLPASAVDLNGELTINNPSPGNSGPYICTASTYDGITRSSEARVTITSVPTAGQAPIVRIEPLMQIVGQGTWAEVKCIVTGHPTPTVRWYKDEEIDRHADIELVGTTLRIANSKVTDREMYICRANNSAGKSHGTTVILVKRPELPVIELYQPIADSDGESKIGTNAGELYIWQGSNSNASSLSSATSVLTITSTPRIELVPIKQVVRPGDSPKITCRVTGDEPVEIRWDRFQIDRPIPKTVSDDRGVLQFNAITSADAGQYVCTARNNAGTARAVAEVLVDDYESSTQVNHRTINTFVGSSVPLECLCEDSSSTVKWSREREDIPITAFRLGNTLELTDVRQEDSGRYVCRVINGNGTSSTTNYIDLRANAEIVPTSRLVIIRIRATPDAVKIGGTIELECNVYGSEKLGVRWIKPNEQSLPPNTLVVNNSIILSDVLASDSGLYRCVANTSEGIFEKDYELVIQDPEGEDNTPCEVGLDNLKRHFQYWQVVKINIVGCKCVDGKESSTCTCPLGQGN